MAIITHTTGSDGTFSAAGALAWDEGHTIVLGADENFVTDAESTAIGTISEKASKVETILAPTYGATTTLMLATGNVHEVTLTGNVTLALDSPAVGQIFVVRLKQDATGSRLLTAWWSGISWPSNIAPILTITANKADSFIFVCRAAGVYDGFVLGQNL